MLPDKIAFVDTETTGASLRIDRVIEIGVVRIENNKIIDTFSTLVNPQIHIPEEITALTGITPYEVEAAPSFFDIRDQFLEIMEDCVMVAHNVRFDYSFLQNEFRILGENFSPKHFCTVKLSRALFPEFPHHNLDSIIERFKFECKRRHRALDDAKILWDFYQKVQTQFDPEVLVAAVQKALKRPSIPINITQQKLDEIPECPGVYIFYGEKGMPLYIGKSVNLHQRVLNHFSSDHFSSTEMKIAQQVKDIETIPTPGEIGALFKESAMIKKMQPLYNRKLRQSYKMQVLKKEQNADGFWEVKLETMSKILPDDLDNIINIFRSKMQAKNFLIELNKQYHLCEKLLSLEKTKSECFGYRLGSCKGACTNKEPSAIYNMRFEMAFSKIKLKPWPFKEAIAIVEQGLESKGEGFIFDKWCYLGKVNFDEGESNTAMEDDFIFDLDMYKILNSFLNNNKNNRKIKLLKGEEVANFLNN